jgi:MFS family permease
MPSTDEIEKPPVRRNIVFLIVAAALLMMSLDSTIVATALDAIQQGLHTSINLAAWTLTAYSFGFVLMLPVSGKLADRFGRRQVFLASVVVFTLASLGCAMAGNIYILILLRAVQAGGGAGFTPTVTGIIVEHFGSARDRYVSLFGSIFPIGAMIGPIFGGYFVGYWSWRDIFYVNVPIGLLIVLFAMRFIPHDPVRTKGKESSMDLTGVALLGCGLLAGMVAVSALGASHSSEDLWPSLALLLFAVAMVAVFLRHIRRAKTPFIAPRLIYGRDFGAVNLVNMTYSGIVIGAMALIPLYAISRYDIGVLQSGTLLTAQGLAALVCSLLAVAALRRTGYRRPLYLGSVITVIGFVLLALPPVLGSSPYVWLACAACLLGAGNGAINPATRNAGLQLAPESSSMLAALRTLSLQIGSIATISVVTAILSYHGDTGRTLAWVFVFLAVLRVLAIPLARWVPEQRGAW